MTVTARLEVLNPWERYLFNVLEEYFMLRQNSTCRMNVLAEVGLTRVIDVHSSLLELNGVQVNAMSFDFVIVDGTRASPQLVFEADGKYHADPMQKNRDATKDYLLARAGIPIVRLEVEGEKESLDILKAEVEIEQFDRDLQYPGTDELGRLSYLDLSGATYNRCSRLVAPLDIELALVKLGWAFPDSWDYVSELWRTHSKTKGIWKPNP
jgi:very-short-patch-repair endonuclease